MGTRLLRLPEVLSRTGLSRSTLYRLLKAGVFPAPISVLHTRCRAWIEDEVQAWVDEQVRIARRAVRD